MDWGKRGFARERVKPERAKPRRQVSLRGFLGAFKSKDGVVSVWRDFFRI